MRRVLYLAFAAATLLTLVSCASWVNPVARLMTTQGAKEREIAALRVEYEGKVVAAKTQAEIAAKTVIADKDAQMVAAATALFGNQLVFQSIVTPTRTDLIQRNLSVEAWTALGNVTPTAEGMRQMAERIAKELDSTRTSLADLQANHAAVLAENQVLADAAKRHAVELAAAEMKVVALEKERDTKVAAKQAELIEVQGKLIAAEKARSDDREANRAALQALKTKASVALGILALAGIAGAIYLPVWREKSILLGVVCAGCAIGLWFIEPWHVAAAAGSAILALFVWMAVKYRKEEKLGDGLVLAMQRVRDQSADLWKTKIAPVIQDQLGRFVKKSDGTVVVERDPTMDALIDKKLMEFEVYGNDPVVPTNRPIL